MPDARVFIVDDDPAMRDSLRTLIETAGYAVHVHEDAGSLLADPALADGGCVLSDVHMPGMSGVELMVELARRNISIPVVIMTGQGDIPLAVRAMKAGAIDFLEKPFDEAIMLAGVKRGLGMNAETRARASDADAARKALAVLTDRERDVFEHLVAGESNKVAAHALGISPRTVEIHRARVLEKLHARSLADLVRLALAAGVQIAGEPAALKNR